MSAIKDFCQSRGMNKTMEETFTMYVKVSYASAYAVKIGDTLSRIVENMTSEKIQDYWVKFIYDFKNTLEQ
jgi:hypothetical protein